MKEGTNEVRSEDTFKDLPLKRTVSDQTYSMKDALKIRMLCKERFPHGMKDPTK